MAINSKRKGKNGELEFSNLCKKHGFNTRRSQQYAGIHGDADVVGLDGIHIEVKRIERLNIEQALQQAERDKKEGEIPIVAHRRNREEWKVTMRAKDWFELYRAWKNVDTVIMTRQFQEELVVEKQKESEVEHDG